MKFHKKEAERVAKGPRVLTILRINPAVKENKTKNGRMRGEQQGPAGGELVMQE